MKMAKPDKRDIEAATKLCLILKLLERVLKDAPGFQNRVIGGMCYVILFDKNKIVDPDAEAIELHPELVSAIEDAERYRWLRAQPNNTETPRIDVVKWEREDESANSGDGLRMEALDAAIDAARKPVGVAR